MLLFRLLAKTTRAKLILEHKTGQGGMVCMLNLIDISAAT